VFQLAFSFGGANLQERYTDGTLATNKTAVITTAIPWDATAAQVCIAATARFLAAPHSNSGLAQCDPLVPLSAPASLVPARVDSQVKEALEGLETVPRVQVRRCDEAGGLGGSGGWLGGCPYGKRNGYSWEVIFEPSYYEDEHNTATGAYQPDGRQL